MENWGKINLEDVCLIKKGEQLNKLDLESAGDYPCINGGISPSGYTEKWNTKANTITISEGGNSCGFVNMLRTDFWSGGHCYSLIDIKDKVDNEFLYYALKGRESLIMDLRVGSGLPNIQQKAIKKFEFIYPEDKTEQTTIASILSKTDQAIAHTEALIAKYTQIKTGLMQDLLTKGIDENGNVRTEQTHEFKDSPLGRIPKEWECEPIGDCCYVTKLAGYEFTLHMKYRDDGEIIALRALNIKNEDLVLDDVQRISKSVSDYLIRSKLFKGDILITYIGAYIGDVVQIKENDKYHLAPNIAKIVVGKKLTSDFLEMILRTEKVQNQFKSLTTTTANPSLTMGQIRKSYVLFPQDKEEQNRIAIKLRSLRKYFLNLKTELSKLQSLKTGLMQDLLSGKVRVNNVVPGDNLSPHKTKPLQNVTVSKLQ